MKEFNILDDFGYFNISAPRHVQALIEEISKSNLSNETHIVLNIEGCQTDYPQTPKLIDYFLSHLSNQSGKKALTIMFNGLATKEIFVLYDIILEGEFFGIYEKINSDSDLSRWHKKINTKLEQFNICFTIKNTKDNIIYIYGCKDN